MPGRELCSVQSHKLRRSTAAGGTKQAPLCRIPAYYLHQIHPAFSKTDYLLADGFPFANLCLLVNFPKLYAKLYTI